MTEMGWKVLSPEAPRYGFPCFLPLFLSVACGALRPAFYPILSFGKHLICFHILLYQAFRYALYILCVCYFRFLSRTEVYHKIPWHVVFQDYSRSMLINKSCNPGKVLVCFCNGYHGIWVYCHFIYTSFFNSIPYIIARIQPIYLIKVHFQAGGAECGGTSIVKIDYRKHFKWFYIVPL